MAPSDNGVVLVTGGTGFVATYCIINLLNAKYRVRTTVRSLKRENDLKDMLKSGGVTKFDELSVFEADLGQDGGWKEAVQGCKYVLHVASPFPNAPPKHENDLIIPAREGALRVLRAAKHAGVKRVVMTSSFGSVGYGHKNWDVSKPFTEEDWSDINGLSQSAYLKSKTIAERAAWDFIKNEGGELEMTTIVPGLILGPILGPDISPSTEVVLRLLNGSLPALPQLMWSAIDVRDVADLHVLAMTSPKAKGERFLCVSPPEITLKDMAVALREHLGDSASKVSTREMPNFLIKIVALFDPQIALVLPDLKSRPASNEKARTVLGWEPRSNVDGVIATAESMIKFGLVKA